MYCLEVKYRNHMEDVKKVLQPSSRVLKRNSRQPADPPGVTSTENAAYAREPWKDDTPKVLCWRKTSEPYGRHLHAVLVKNMEEKLFSELKFRRIAMFRRGKQKETEKKSKGILGLRFRPHRVGGGGGGKRQGGMLECVCDLKAQHLFIYLLYMEDRTT